MSPRWLSSWREVALALASGVAVACFAALHPALEAVHLSPLESARQALWQPGFRAGKSSATRLGFAMPGARPRRDFMARAAPGPVAQFSVGMAGMLLFLLGLAFLLSGCSFTTALAGSGRRCST